MAHTTTWTQRGVTWTFSGLVTGEELLRSNREVYSDPRFGGIEYQLVDLTQVTHFDVTNSDMKALAEADHSAARANPAVRVAVAADDDAIRSLSLYYEAQSSDSPWDQQIFDTLEEAEAWVRNE